MIGAVEFEAGNEAGLVEEEGRATVFFVLVEGMICTDIHVLYIYISLCCFPLSLSVNI